MSRSANQTKHEPFPASASGSESEAETPGSDHPQGPSGTAEGGPGDVGDATSVPAASEQPAPGSSEETPVLQGLHTPDLDESDTRT